MSAAMRTSMGDVEPGQAVAYGTLPDGREIERYVLGSAGGIRVGILTYGGIIESIDVPDVAGHYVNVVLGYRDLAGYVQAPNTYFGSIIGRYGNRIANARFTLNETEYSLPVNNPPNSLHGGAPGFDRAVWSVEEATALQLRLRYVSPDGEQGYPGQLDVQVTYSVENESDLHITYGATTTAATVVNLTNHSYFNLQGESSGDVLDTLLTIDAAQFTPVNAALIPTGELAGVAGTPFDFRTAQAIGARICQAHPQLVAALGYDHNWVLDRRSADTLVRAARATDPHSGRALDVLTTEPGIQFYSGNFLDRKRSRQRRIDLPAVGWIRIRNAAFSELAESAVISIDALRARADVSFRNDLTILSATRPLTGDGTEKWRDSGVHRHRRYRRARIAYRPWRMGDRRLDVGWHRRT